MASANTTNITMLAVRQHRLHDAGWVAGALVAMHEAAVTNATPAGYRFRLATFLGEVCDGPPPCPISAAGDAAIAAFVANTSDANIVLQPHFAHSGTVIDAAASAGRLVINPQTLRLTDFKSSSVLLLGQRLEGELVQMMAYMMFTHACARIGIMYVVFPGVDGLVAVILSSYKAAGLPTPVTATVPLSAAAAKAFVFDDPHRTCFIVLDELVRFRDFLANVRADSRFVPGQKKFFGASPLFADLYEDAGSSAHYEGVYALRSIPSFQSTLSVSAAYRAAFAAWHAAPRTTDELLAFSTNDTIPTTPTESGFLMYVATRYGMALTGRALQAGSVNASAGAPPLPKSQAVADAAFSAIVQIEDFPLGPLTRHCAQPPFPQTCFCNSASRVMFVYAVNATDGHPRQQLDDATLGQRDAASSYVSAEECSKAFTMQSFPFRFLIVGSTDPELGLAVQRVNQLAHLFTRSLNFANPRPPRPFRMVERHANASTTRAVVDTATAEVEPFILVGTFHPITQSNVLSLFNGVAIDLEEPVLTPRGEWAENLVRMWPTGADVFMTFAAYYSEQPAGRYTSVWAIAVDSAHATTITNAFHTFQVPISVVIAPTTEALNTSLVAALARGGLRPFVVVGAVNRQDLHIFAYAFWAAVPAGPVLALLADESLLFHMPASFGNLTGADIFVNSLFSAWWLPDNQVRQVLIANGVAANDTAILDDPLSYYVVVSYSAAYQISQQAFGDTDTAAELLYRAGSVATGDVTIGPFYNDTCTPEEIAANTRDRTCQCTKGPRKFRLLSVRAWQQRLPSTPTGNFEYTMTTCGAHYLPLKVPAAALFTTAELAALIASIAAFFVIVLLLAGLAIFCVFGMRHWHAPRDKTRPFTIAFTDIQSSTTLWARAPAAMSAAVEQHHETIRKLIAQHKGYEVKTIGDSFMVAFAAPERACAFSVAIQDTFFTAPWPPEIDNVYRDLVREQHEETASQPQQPSSHGPDLLTPLSPATPMTPDGGVAPMLTNEEYTARWNGIRVRVGVNMGYGEIKRDPTTKGYDYYGTVVNTAARVEGVGHGGQVLVTEDVMASLRASADGGLQGLAVTDLGPQSLRGLDAPVRLFQLQPPHLAQRYFPRLRLDIEHDADGGSTATDTASNMTVTPESAAQRLTQGKMVGDVGASDLLKLFHFTNTAIATSTPSWQKATLGQLGKRWRVPNTASTGESHRTTAIMSLVLKVARAARLKGVGFTTASQNSSLSTPHLLNTTPRTATLQPPHSTGTGTGGAAARARRFSQSGNKTPDATPHDAALTVEIPDSGSRHDE